MASAGDEPIPLDRETRQLISLLVAAARKCRQLIQHPPGKTDSARSFHSSRAAQQLAGIERELSRLKQRAVSIAGKKIAQAYKEGVSEADRMASEAGVRPNGSPFVGDFNVIDSRRAQVLIRDTAGDLSKAVDSMAQNTRRLVRKIQGVGLDDAKINRMLAGGTIEGVPRTTLQELKKEVRKAAVDGKIVTFNTRTGVVMDFHPDDYAEMVFQTKIAEATNVATVERLAARGLYYVKIIGSNSRNFCTAFVGRVFYTGPGEDPRGLFPHVRTLPRGGPPFHPRCTKRFVAFVIDLATPAQIEAGKLKPNERELLNKSSSEAQKAFAAKNPPPTKMPPPQAPADRVAAVRRAAADTRRKLREIGEGTQATIDRLSAEQRQIGDLLENAGYGADIEQMNALVDRAATIFDQLAEVRTQRAEAGRAVVQAENPTSISYLLDSGLGPVRRKVAEDGLDFVRKLVDRSLISFTDVIVRVPSAAIFNGERSYYSPGKIHLANDATRLTTIHEFGHHLEAVVPGMLQGSLNFLRRRTTGDKLQMLALLTGNSDYGPAEKAWPDDFLDPYMGKDYRGTGTEVVTMALERLWNDPIDFARRDPDHFEFIYNALRGVFE